MEENVDNLQNEVVENESLNNEQVEIKAPELESEFQGEPEEQEEEKELSIDELPLPGEEAEKKKELPKWAEKRISKKEKELAEAKAELERVKNIQNMRAAAHPVKDEKEPLREHYQDEGSFLDARIEYKAKIDRRLEDKYRQEQAMYAAEMEFRKRWNTAEDAGYKKYDDFEEKTEVLNSDEFPRNRAMAEAISRSKYSADILYTLGMYPDQARKIAMSDPIDAVREIAKLEIRFKENTKPNITKAPKVIKPVNSNAGGTPANDPEKMNPDEFSEWYKATYNR